MLSVTLIFEPMTLKMSSCHVDVATLITFITIRAGIPEIGTKMPQSACLTIVVSLQPRTSTCDLKILSVSFCPT